MSSADTDEIIFEEEVVKHPKRSSKSSKAQKRVKNADDEEPVVEVPKKSKARAPKTQPPPLESDGEEEVAPATPVRKKKVAKPKAGTRQKKVPLDPLPEEEEPAPAGRPKPHRIEQNVTSAFNTLQNKRDDKVLKRGDEGYYCLDDLIQEYVDRGFSEASEEYKNDPRYVTAKEYFDRINKEWIADVEKWKAENVALAEYKDRIRTARRKRTALLKEQERQKKDEEFKNLQLTVQAIKSGLVPLPNAPAAAPRSSALAFASSDTGPVTCMQDVVNLVFEARAQAVRIVDESYSTILAKLVPNHAVSYSKASRATPARKKMRKAPVVIEDESEDSAGDVEES